MASYTVKRGDNLWTILRNRLGRPPTTTELRNAASQNGIRLTGSGANMVAHIQPGQVLNFGNTAAEQKAAQQKAAQQAAAQRAAQQAAAQRAAQQAAAQRAAQQRAAQLAAQQRAAQQAAAQAAARAAQQKAAQQAAALAAQKAAAQKAAAAQAAAEAAAAERAAAKLWQEVVEFNPWLATLGIAPERLKELAATSSGTTELLVKLRGEDVVKRRTQAMYRADGTRRFATEAELFRWEDQVRGVLRQGGVDVDREYATPETLIGLAEGNLSPDELRDRLAVWKGVKESGQRAREIFYVYAGLNFTDDDLYEALVDGGKGQELQNAVNAGVANQLSSPNAWEQWIDRARQAGNARLETIFQQAQQQGSTYAATIQRVMNVDPAFANQVMDALYTGGDPSAGDFLDLTSLLDAYEAMAVGAAAEGAGLELPTLERLKEIRAAGIERSQAINAYQQFGLDKDRLNAAVLRARGQTFTQTDFENATFFGDIEARREFEAGTVYREAAGRQQGQFGFSRGRRGQFVQSGLSAR